MDNSMRAIFVDIETTGLSPYKHRLLELALKIVDLTTGEEIATYEAIVQQPTAVWKNSDPVSLKINGFSPQKSAQGRTESVISSEVEAFLESHVIRRGEAIFIAQNSSFDRAFFAQLIDPCHQEQLQWPYHWLDLASMYWCVRSTEQSHQGLPPPDRLSLSKDEIADRYGIPPEATPHLAINGVNHLITCYNAVLAGQIPGSEEA
ncbi:hypothetical protein SCG7086_AO_00130 [Chlamydiales bacterium SCGC AG-110-P3]|nr:hypothetical protein SCG7086_AO_00130 [Chlamydiales bacterium SCGC AG-110-P3]